MDRIGSIETASARDGDRVVAALVAGLEIEFGRGAGGALALRFLAAEEADFLWDARLAERWLGAYQDADDEACELDRIAICGCLDGRWFAGVMLVDGDGSPQGIIGKSWCTDRKAARGAMAHAR